MADKRIIDFQVETTQLSDGDYLPLDNANNGSSKYKPYRLQAQINDINSELSGITTAESTDVGKALSPKTVSGGAVTEWQFKTISGGGGGGTSDYTDLDNKPQINGVTLTGNKTAADLGITVPQAATATPASLGTAAVGSSSKYAREDHVHPMPSASDVGALPSSTTYVSSVNGQTGAVTIGNATTSASGLMSATDKSRLDDLYADYSSALTALGVI